jgi:hypothetical protein
VGAVATRTLRPEHYLIVVTNDTFTHRAGTVLGTGVRDEDVPPPATSTEVIYTFMAIPHRHLIAHNWGTAMKREDAALWNIPETDTYINGVILTVDGDYWMGYLLEAVDRTSGCLTFIAVNLYHGRRGDGWFDHDYMTYDKQVGVFFDRTDDADYSVVGQWAVSRIYGMAESYFRSSRGT